MKTIAIVNTKGGSCKSTTAHFIAAGLTLIYRKKVLVIDLDNQATISELISQDRLLLPNHLAESLFNDAPDEPATINEIDLLAGSNELRALDNLDSMYCHKAVANIGAFSNRYDFCIIDTPGSDCTRTMAALMASDYVLIPVTLDKVALDALPLTKRLFDLVRASSNPKLKLLGFLPSRVKAPVDGKPSTITEKDFYKQLASTFPDLVFPLIASRTDFIRAQAEGLYITQIPKRNIAAETEVNLFLETLLDRI